MQTLGDSRAAEYMKGRKTLEINPDHPIIQALKDKVDSDAAGAKVWCIKESCYMSKWLKRRSTAWEYRLSACLFIELRSHASRDRSYVVVRSNFALAEAA